MYNNKIINGTLLDTLKCYNLKDKNKTTSNIYNFKLYIRKYLLAILKTKLYDHDKKKLFTICEY